MSAEQFISASNPCENCPRRVSPLPDDFEAHHALSAVMRADAADIAGEDETVTAYSQSDQETVLALLTSDTLAQQTGAALGCAVIIGHGACRAHFYDRAHQQIETI